MLQNLYILSGMMVPSRQIPLSVVMLKATHAKGTSALSFSQAGISC